MRGLDTCRKAAGPARLVFLLLLLALGVWLQLRSARVALADGPTILADEPTIEVSTNSPVPLQVDGVDVTKQAAVVKPGTMVCAQARVVYASEAERWVFQRWSHGPTVLCVVIADAGTYNAIFAHEVLLHIRSTVPSVQRSMWVAAGSPVPVAVPERVEESDRVRYLFKDWDSGETPFQPQNSVALLKPANLEVRWTKEYLIEIKSVGPDLEFAGSGWYTDGLGLVLQTPGFVLEESAGLRWRFVRWETVGTSVIAVPNADNAITTVRIGAPYNLRAVYEKQYRILARGPTGTLKRDWVKEGDEVALETPPVLETVPGQQRLVFKRWDGFEGLVSSKISGTVNRPIEVRAVYDRELMVTVNSRLGASGDGWYKEGSPVTVSVPAAAQRWLVLKTTFAGFPGYASQEPTVTLLASEPTTISALYRTEVDIKVLGLLVAVPLELAFIYLAVRWADRRLLPNGGRQRQRARTPDAHPTN